MSRDKKSILIVDDTETNIDILLELLGDSYDILVALDGESAFNILESEQVDLILLDVMMPNMNGYEVCSILKNQEHTKYIPVIFTTARIDENSIEKAYEVGGIDFIKKPFNPMELFARIKTHIKLKTVIDDLEHTISYDQMTGVYNRKKFFELSISKFEESKKDLYAVVIHIDKFKTINNTFGHTLGDKVIKEVAKTIDKNIMKNSIYGRVGGAEFSIICRSDSSDVVFKNIQTIRKEIDKLKVVSNDGDEIHFSISAGIAQVTDDTKNIDTLLKEAYDSLYLAKNKVTNNVIFRGAYKK